MASLVTAGSRSGYARPMLPNLRQSGGSAVVVAETNRRTIPGAGLVALRCVKPDQCLCVICLPKCLSKE